MNRLIFVFAVALSILQGTYVSGAQKSNLLMPNGFDGIYLGMPVEELRQVRPNADLSPMDKIDNKQTRGSAQSYTLYENENLDTIYGLPIFIFYKIENNTLERLRIVWAGDIKLIILQRSNFISSCERLWGSDYRKMVTMMDPSTKYEHLAPLLVWDKDDVRVEVVCTSDDDRESIEKGAMMIEMYKGDISGHIGSKGYNVDDSLHKKLYRGIGISIPDSVDSEKADD